MRLDQCVVRGNVFSEDLLYFQSIFKTFLLSWRSLAIFAVWLIPLVLLVFSCLGFMLYRLYIFHLFNLSYRFRRAYAALSSFSPKSSVLEKNKRRERRLHSPITGYSPFSESPDDSSSEEVIASSVDSRQSPPLFGSNALFSKTQISCLKEREEVESAYEIEAVLTHATEKNKWRAAFENIIANTNDVFRNAQILHSILIRPLEYSLDDVEVANWQKGEKSGLMVIAMRRRDYLAREGILPYPSSEKRAPGDAPVNFSAEKEGDMNAKNKLQTGSALASEGRRSGALLSPLDSKASRLSGAEANWFTHALSNNGGATRAMERLQDAVRMSEIESDFYSDLATTRNEPPNPSPDDEEELYAQTIVRDSFDGPLISSRQK